MTDLLSINHQTSINASQQQFYMRPGYCVAAYGATGVASRTDCARLFSLTYSSLAETASIASA